MSTFSLNATNTKEFFKFCIVGAICTAIDYVVFYVSSPFIKYQIAVILSFIVSFIINYFLTAFWTFQVNPTKTRFLGMVTCHLINLFAIRIGLLTLFVEILLINKDIAYIPVLIISAFTSFIMMRFVFKYKPKDKTSHSNAQQ